MWESGKLSKSRFSPESIFLIASFSEVLVAEILNTPSSDGAVCHLKNQIRLLRSTVPQILVKKPNRES